MIRNQSSKARFTNDISKKDFYQLFDFVENNRSKKDLKADYKEIKSISNVEKVKFKHLVDYYLKSGDDFYESLRSIDSNKILQHLSSKPKTALDAEVPEGAAAKELILEQVEMSDDFNERLLKAMCLNKSISKLNREINVLTEVRDQILGVMEDQVESEKLDNLISQMKLQPTIKTNFNFGAVNEVERASKASSMVE